MQFTGKNNDNLLKLNLAMYEECIIDTQITRDVKLRYMSEDDKGLMYV